MMFGRAHDHVFAVFVVFQLSGFVWSRYYRLTNWVMFLYHTRDSHPKGDGGSGRRPLPPDHLTF